ncbi:hypothetical protein [Salmonirosea aquatica]|uniref:Uncharacterized protein n=1 Tax=Salmonirosea aquatica TaxID=2654236 RepID=A0A7C9FTK5_9BACT|nr:hypothetical protein [Cytophagaceae bacterium SJW1-29]
MPTKRIKYPTVVLDTEQLGFHYDTIQCPTCGLVQKARIIDTKPRPTYLHECKACKWIIEGDEWNSVVPV